MLASLGAPPIDAFTTIRDRWIDLVGPQAAEALVPVAVEHGRIVATATSGVWASQAKWLEPALVARAAELLGEGVVDGLVVRTREADRDAENEQLYPSGMVGERTLRLVGSRHRDRGR